MSVRALIVVAALMLPSIAQAHLADRAWRWQDANGQLHYSNVPERIPPYAQRVRGTVGRITTTAIPASARTQAPRMASEMARPRPGRGHYMHHATYRCPLGGYGPHALTVNGHSLADQVQQAALYDALNIRWRAASCR